MRRSKAAELATKMGRHVEESIGVRNGVVAAKPAPVADPKWEGVARSAVTIREIALGQIDPDSEQPRRQFDDADLDELAASLRRDGQLVEVKVWWDAARSRWVLVWGERRYRAAIRAGLDTLRCQVLAGRPDRAQLRRWQVAENDQRQDLAPLDLARAIEAHMAELGLSARKAAEDLGIGHARATKALALLKLPEDVQARVERGELGASAAYEVSKVADPAAQRELAGRAAGGGLRRDQVAAEVKARKGVVPGEPRPPASPPARPKSEGGSPGTDRGAPTWTVSNIGHGQSLATARYRDGRELSVLFPRGQVVDQVNLHVTIAGAFDSCSDAFRTGPEGKKP